MGVLQLSILGQLQDYENELLWNWHTEAVLWKAAHRGFICRHIVLFMIFHYNVKSLSAWDIQCHNCALLKYQTCD